MKKNDTTSVEESIDTKQFELLVEHIHDSEKKYDVDMIREAYLLAKESHAGQMRLSGEPYVCHPIAVSEILVQIGMDTDSVIAGMLHDVVEDTHISLEEIEERFGKDVEVLVDGVTKLGKISYVSKEQAQQENVRKMLLAMNQDIRVIIIKLADRLHNMRTLDAQSPAKQREKSNEVLDVYAPIAHRLGIREIKEEMEDLAIYYIDREAYLKIDNSLEIEKEDRRKFLKEIELKLRERMDKEGMDGEIQARVKSIYGIYRKMYGGGKGFDEIYDVYALRVIVDTISDCYAVLGLAHDMFTVIPNRFKDYIATPKPNMYQSLHTTVLNRQAIPFEIQIRTWEMHHTAELGIAAHWKYKTGVEAKDSLEERILWVRQLLDSQNDEVDDIVNTIKTDLGNEEVFVFTPQGDVKILPKGANIIDFAYSIHSEIGNKLTGAKVNNRIMNIYHEVEMGEIIEILTTNNPNHGPSRDWLGKVRTSTARGKIRAWFKKERRDENIEEGRLEIEKELRRSLIHFTADELEEVMREIGKKHGYPSADDLYATVGYGGMQVSKIVKRVKDDYVKRAKKEEEEENAYSQESTKVTPKIKTKPTSGVIVEGVDDILVKFAKCCAPVPGDDIIGFITRGHGVSIHKQDCINVINSMKDTENQGRWLKTYWANEVKETFRVGLEITAENKPGVIADVSIQLANLSVSLHELNARELKNGTSLIIITISIEHLDQLHSIMTSLRNLPAVHTVTRTGQ